jgi:hypothetical protein
LLIVTNARQTVRPVATPQSDGTVRITIAAAVHIGLAPVAHAVITGCRPAGGGSANTAGTVAGIIAGKPITAGWTIGPTIDVCLGPVSHIVIAGGRLTYLSSTDL